MAGSILPKQFHHHSLGFESLQAVAEPTVGELGAELIHGRLT